MLAQKLGWEFVDGDDFHSPASKEKMGRGEPLTDADRMPWLESLREVVLGWLDQGTNGILACSALKRSYREKLRTGPEVRFIYLKRDSTLLEQRLRERTGHFAGSALLSSQIESLEEPSQAEAAITIAEEGTAAAVAKIISTLGVEERQDPNSR
jgi:carbohydrate kinase (thermoresistant glucokinase family)